LKDGKADGMGVLIDKNMNIYIGEFRKGLKDGFGRYK